MRVLWGSDSDCSLVSSAKEVDSPELNMYFLFLNNTNFLSFKRKQLGHYINR